MNTRLSNVQRPTSNGEKSHQQPKSGDKAAALRVGRRFLSFSIRCWPFDVRRSSFPGKHLMLFLTMPKTRTSTSVFPWLLHQVLEATAGRLLAGPAGDRCSRAIPRIRAPSGRVNSSWPWPVSAMTAWPFSRMRCNAAPPAC